MDELEQYQEGLQKVEILSEVECILSGYLVHLNDDIDIAIKCIRDKDPDTLYIISHKVYGTAETYGLKVVGDIFKDIRRLYSEQEEEVLVNLMLQLKDYVKKFELKLQSRTVSH